MEGNVREDGGLLAMLRVARLNEANNLEFCIMIHCIIHCLIQDDHGDCKQASFDRCEPFEDLNRPRIFADVWCVLNANSKGEQKLKHCRISALACSACHAHYSVDFIKSSDHGLHRLKAKKAEF